MLTYGLYGMRISGIFVKSEIIPALHVRLVLWPRRDSGSRPWRRMVDKGEDPRHRHTGGASQGCGTPAGPPSAARGWGPLGRTQASGSARAIPFPETI